MAMAMAFLVVICLQASSPLAGADSPSLDRRSRAISYDGYSVFEVIPSSEAQVSWLHTLACRSLTDHVGVSHPSQLLCDKTQARALKQAARKLKVSVRQVSRNLGSEIRQEARSVDVLMEQGVRRRRKSSMAEGRRRVKKVKKRRQEGQDFKHKSYLGTDLIYQWLDRLDQRFDGVTLEKIGHTAEGRDIKVVKLNSGNSSLPTIFIDAGIHAREWISPASILFCIEKIARKLNKGRGQADVGSFQWHIVPMANPDGYEYTRSTDRMWRKNTVSIPGSHCIGVDLNRNFPEGYGVGASTDPCSEVYQGKQPFSELESRTIRDYLHKQTNVRVAISVHSFGSVLIYPWGYKTSQHPRRSVLSSLAKNMSSAILSRTGESYQPGTAREVFGAWGLAGGATDDWYITQGIPYSYTFELPEFDEAGRPHGFILPASNIIRVGKQLLAGLATMAARLASQNR